MFHRHSLILKITLSMILSAQFPAFASEKQQFDADNLMFKKAWHDVENNRDMAVEVYVTNKKYPTIAIFEKNSQSDALKIYRYTLDHRNGIPIRIVEADGRIGQSYEVIVNKLESPEIKANLALPEAEQKLLGFKIISKKTRDPYVTPTPIAELLLNGVEIQLTYGWYLASGVANHEDIGHEYPIISEIETPNFSVSFEYERAVSMSLHPYSHYDEATVTVK
jgi:hypothetical protein